MEISKIMKVIVAHPGKQHSYRLATALERNNYLQYYVTTVYKKRNSALFRLLGLFLSRDNKKRAESRRSDDIPEYKIKTFCVFHGLLELLLLRLDKSTNLYRRLHSKTVRRFGVEVAKLAINEGADIVVCYDSNAISCFPYLKEHAPNIKRVLDVSIASRHYMKDIYDNEIAKTGKTDLKDENEYLWNNQSIFVLKKEIWDSEYFLVASDFVKDSIVDLGIKEDHILKIPYGANVESNILRKNTNQRNPIKFLFAGQVIYRKGITYVLEAAKRLDGAKATLDVVGPYNPASWFVKEYSQVDNIKFHGAVTHDTMKSIYEKSDVFVLPSFAEGMALVGIEAMACGLPIICTYNSGLSDLVDDGVNGYIIPAGDVGLLENRMRWFIDNPGSVVEMGEKAKERAKSYSWNVYEERVAKGFLRILK